MKERVKRCVLSNLGGLSNRYKIKVCAEVLQDSSTHSFIQLIFSFIYLLKI